MKQTIKNKGFTLMELMVSVGLTAIMMLGVATFFSSTFRSMFVQREKVTNTQSQFVVNTILSKKLENVVGLDDSDSGFAVLMNQQKNGELPYSYISSKSTEGGEFIVFKDFFVFNGMVGGTPSYGTADVDHPAGLSKIGADSYVVAPLEDKIYKCDNWFGTCSDFGIADLDMPIDVTSNGVDTLYVSDAGNDRIIQITDLGGSKTVTNVITDLDFPAGLAFYSAPSATEYLFVSEPYLNRVQKVDIVTGDSEVIVGAGGNEACDNSAKNCALKFPTGLVVGGGELYIADTGNGRVLKVSDPGFPSDFEIEFLSPDADEAIREIRFTFPSDTDTAGGSLDNLDSDHNELRDTGNEDFSGEEFTYELWTTLLDDTLNTNACAPDPCVPDKDKLDVADPELFNSTDFKDIYMDGEYLEVAWKGGSILNLDSDFSSHQSAGEEVTLVNLIPADTTITFTLSSIDTTGVAAGFEVVEIEMFDEDEASLGDPHTHTVRIGDGELGTSEDLITVDSDGYDYITGLGWSGGLQTASSAEYETSFDPYDYTSDFEVSNFEFTTLDVDDPPDGTDDLLELQFDAKVGEDEEENPIWESFIMNADLRP